MDRKYVKSTVEGLKSTSSSCVQETLGIIRNRIISKDEGVKLFRECRGLEYMVPHLRKPNERILDMTLSILGNCCLEEESSLLVGKLNSFPPLISIIKTVCRDSIVGRACRVIGNLAQKPCNAEGLHNHGAVSALITLIDNRDKTTSYPTLTMAVRAIRQLWMVTEKRDEMLSLNAVQCIAILLTTECETAGIIKSIANSNDSVQDNPRKSQEELISGLLKCVGYFTVHSTNLCAEQIIGDGRGYQCLVALTKKYETLALKCLINLCFISQCRPLLGNAGLVECLVEILQRIPDASWWPEGAARALAHLSAESVNRSRLKHSGGLRLLISAAKINLHAMHALLQYVFDVPAFKILINEGITTFLTDELKKYVSTMEIQHKYTERETSTATPTKKKKISSPTRDDIEPSLDNACCTKTNLRRRRRNLSVSTNEEDLSVVIERDNVVVSFIDKEATDKSDDSEDEDDHSKRRRRKSLKRNRSKSPTHLKMRNQFIRISQKGTLNNEPKMPDWMAQGPSSPERLDSASMSPVSDGNQSGFSPEYRPSSCKRARWDWSPESGFGTGDGSSTSSHWNEYPWSPSSSASPTSPFSINEDSSDSEISGRYSPVCSENEGECPKETTHAPDMSAEIEATEVALDELIMDDGDDDEITLEENAMNIEASAKSSRIGCVLLLLVRVSRDEGSPYNKLENEPTVNHSQELLSDHECLNSLLDYVEKCKHPLGNGAIVLSKMFSEPLCLISILKYRIVFRVHKMSVTTRHPISRCRQCKEVKKLSLKLLSQLTTLAESSHGIGEISYQFLKGTTCMKDTLALTIPYIVKTKKNLKKYLIDCDGLNLLFTIINESKEDMQDCVQALTKLATNIHIKDPKTLEKRFKDKICVSYDPILDNLSIEDIVTFELDNTETVKANKVFLCQNSEVFNAMLMGCFKESIDERVRLKNVSKNALEYLFTLLNFGLNNNNCDIQVIPITDSLETSLEVLLLADRFLFEKLKELLTSAILQFQLTPETADKIYVWSLSDGMGFLCVESVAYILTGKMCETSRTRAFQSILSLEYKEQWLDDVKTMIVRHLEK